MAGDSPQKMVSVHSLRIVPLCPVWSEKGDNR